MRHYDHMDIRVSDLTKVSAFYQSVLPELGFTRQDQVEGWLQFSATGVNEVAEFLGITEAPNHVPNECRIAFWAETPAEVDRLASVLEEAGARNLEGPAYESPDYYAVFFEDPSGNRFEICHRTRQT
jgi:predicted enzyme related to lactoylglutathione lyase